MPSPLSLWMQADPRTSTWHSLITTEDLAGIEARLAAAEQFGQRRDLLRDGIRDSAWFGSRATVETFLRLGASVDCEDNDDRTPLLRSIERNDDESVALLLIERGANVNAQEYAGRTPLMQCIWRNRMQVFKTLLEQPTIDVELKDKRGRNALHHLATDLDRADKDKGQPSYNAKTPHNKDILEGLIKKSPTLLRTKDEYDRTCLHWAASNGNSQLVELVVEKRQRQKRPYVNHAFSVTDYQERSPIHIAAAKEHFSIVMTMLNNLQLAPDEVYTNINDMSVGNWTILLLVVQSPKAPLDIVQRLVQYGADVNRCVQDGKNALHLAALNGNYSIIKFMLDQKTMQRTKRDNFGDTPLLCMARYALGNKNLEPEQRKKLLLLFAPWKDPFRPKGEAENTAKHHRPAIYVFDKQVQSNTGENAKSEEDPNSYRRDTWRELESSIPLSIYDLIYADDRDRPDDPFVPTVSKDDATFKWVHLPANSIPWCLDLVSKHFIELSLKGDIHGLQELERAFAHHERHNTDPHFSYMTPICETISISQSTGNAAVGTVPLRASSFTVSQATAPEYNARRSSGGQASGIHRSIHSPLQPPLRLAPPLFSTEDIFPWRSNPPQPQTPKDDAAAEGLVDKRTGMMKLLTTMVQAMQGDPVKMSDTKISSMFLFMPYLHHEFATDQDKMCKLAEKISKEHSRPEDKAEPPHDGKIEQIELLRSHSVSDDTMTLHLRRTLDQYSYQHMNTKGRELDQFFQHVKVQSRPKKGSSWLPRVLGGQALDNVQAVPNAPDVGADPMPTERQRQQFPRLRYLMVDQLWMLVLSNDLVITCCPSPWEAPAGKQSDMLHRVIDFIRSNNNNEVSSVWELALLIVGRFYGSHSRLFSEDRYDFLNIFKKALGAVKDEEIRMLKNLQAVPFVSSAHLQKLIKITKETVSLREIKNITDELDILDVILAAQQHVHTQMKDAYNHLIRHDDVYKSQRAYNIFADHQRSIEHPREEIARMAGQSTKIEQSILTLMDFDQLEANLLQASSTARSGAALMSFTMVTIVFLPLTFISSFFTMQLEEYPKNEQGEISLPAKTVMIYIFGIGMPIATTLIIVALFADGTKNLLYGICHELLSLARAQLEKLEIEKTVRMERAREEREHVPVILRSTTSTSTDEYRTSREQTRWQGQGKSNGNSNGLLHGNGSAMIRRMSSPSVEPGTEMV